ncbi:hypothetical protein E4U51_001581 [Claviceps purpurea]|nr:hypothetical protein E4U51_001581 [Claviceps purpurea]
MRYHYHGKKLRVEKSSAGSTTTGVDTPTSETDSIMDIPNRDATLQSGQRYVLIERQSGSVLIAVGEDAVLQTCENISAFHSQWHWHWDCVDDDGWITLRNRITGNYLGASSTFWNPAVKVRPRGDGFTGRLVVWGTPDAVGAVQGGALADRGGEGAGSAWAGERWGARVGVYQD